MHYIRCNTRVLISFRYSEKSKGVHKDNEMQLTFDPIAVGAARGAASQDVRVVTLRRSLSHPLSTRLPIESTRGVYTQG